MQRQITAQTTLLTFVTVFVIWPVYGCGAGGAETKPPKSDMIISSRSVQGHFDRDLLTEAARRENQRPLKVAFEATDQLTGQTVWPELAISGAYAGDRLKGVRVGLKNGRSVLFVPRSLVNIIGGKLPFDIFDDGGKKIQEVVVDLSPAPKLSNRAKTDWEEAGRWLIRVGAIALAVALPALLVAGVFGVTLVVTVAVARVIGALIWVVFQLGLLAVAAGLLIAIVRVFIPDASSDQIRDWLLELWQQIVSIARELFENLERKEKKGWPNPNSRQASISALSVVRFAKVVS